MGSMAAVWAGCSVEWNGGMPMVEWLIFSHYACDGGVGVYFHWNMFTI